MQGWAAVVAGAALFAILAAPVASTSESSHGYANRASTCDLLRFVGVEVGAPCPVVRQQGTLVLSGCAGDVCTLRAVGQAEGGGVSFLAKRLVHEMSVNGLGLGPAVCEATTRDAALACQGSAEATFPLPDGGCARVEIRSTLYELDEVEPRLPVRAVRAWDACREGGDLVVTR